MNDLDPVFLTKAQLAAALADQRVGMVESYLLASIRALKSDEAVSVDSSSRLADLAIDSLQIIELKFSLDQLLGRETDVELIISNPTVGELAAGSVLAATF